MSNFLFPISRLPRPRRRKIGFQDALGRNGIQPRFKLCPARACSAQVLFSFERGEMLVDQLGGDAESAGHSLGKATRQPSCGVSRTVRARGDADYEQHRAPLSNHALNGRETPPVIGPGDSRKRMRQPGFKVSDGNTDASCAEVEGQDRSGFRRVMRYG